MIHAQYSLHPRNPDETVAYHKSASALGGLTKIEDIAPLVKFLVTDGWWITGQTILANGGSTTRSKQVSIRVSILLGP